MRSLSTENQAALAARQLVTRDFLRVVPRRLSDDERVNVDLWSDIGTFVGNVIDPATGLSQERTFEGSGTLVEMDDIPLVSNVTSQAISIRLSQIDERIESLVRAHDCKLARLEIHRGLFDPSTRALVSPAPVRFFGIVNNLVLTTPAEGEEGSVVLECLSDTHQMNRGSVDTRSHESQLRRSGTDNFFQDVTVVKDWQQYWGRKSGKVATAAPTPIRALAAGGAPAPGDR